MLVSLSEIGLGRIGFNSMKWFGPSMQIDILEDKDELIVRATSVTTVVSLGAPFVFVVLMAYVAFRDRSLPGAVFAIYAIGIFLFHWRRKIPGELRVSELEVVAEGDLGESTAGYVRL